MKKADLKKHYPILIKVSLLVTALLLIGLMSFTPGFRTTLKIVNRSDITSMIDIPDEQLIDIKQPDKIEVKPVRKIVESDGGDDVELDDIIDMNTGDFSNIINDSIYTIYEEAPAPLSALKPDYPELARQFTMEGKVFLRAVVEKNGTVSDVWVIKTSGYDILDKAAMECVRNAVFNPAKTRDIALRSEVTLVIDFRLE